MQLFVCQILLIKTNEILKGYKTANSFDDDSPLKSEFNDSILKLKQDINDYLYNKLKISKDGKAYYNYNKKHKSVFGLPYNILDL